MTRSSNTHVSISLRHLIEAGCTALIRRLTHFNLGSWLFLGQKYIGPRCHRHQQHLGMLDDQLLDDLGLQRSEIRAAEYGILPGNQALHHTNASLSPSDDKA